ncbi:MAG: hypothetical protein ACK5D5_11850 [Bacteroidota bacterium]|jgi:hypothetical protein
MNKLNTNLKLKLFLSTFLLLFTSVELIQAQSYVRSRKNFCVILGNQSGVQNSSLFNPQLEFGKIKGGLLLRGGAGMYNNLLEIKGSGRNPETNSETRINRNFFGVAGIDLPIFTYSMFDSKKRAYCMSLLNSFLLGVDVIKGINGPVNSSFGYRARLTSVFFLVRSGAAKRDIKSTRQIHIGYAYTKQSFHDGTQIPLHSIMMNFMLVKHKLIKFADM